jgi:hypothetical protein
VSNRAPPDYRSESRGPAATEQFSTDVGGIQFCTIKRMHVPRSVTCSVVVYNSELRSMDKVHKPSGSQYNIYVV